MIKKFNILSIVKTREVDNVWGGGECGRMSNNMEIINSK